MQLITLEQFLLIFYELQSLNGATWFVRIHTHESNYPFFFFTMKDISLIEKVLQTAKQETTVLGILPRNPTTLRLRDCLLLF